MGSGTGLDGCHACIKYLMFAFNFIFWLVGCALVGTGIWIMVGDSFKDIAKNVDFAFLQYCGIALIAVGGVIMLVGFFGCCGAIRESQCLLVMFFICMLLLFLALVAGGVMFIVFKDEMIDKAESGFGKAVLEYDSYGQNPVVDSVQAVFKCCGVNGAIDYLGTGKALPGSCGLFEGGCKNIIPKTLGDYIVVIAGVSIGAGVIMLLGMIFSMVLCCAIHDTE